MVPSTALETGLAERRVAFEELRERLKSTAAPARRALLASGIPDLDRMLSGGFPRGALVTLEGAAGRWAIVARLLASATCRGLAAVIDSGSLYPPDLVVAGVAIERLLVVPAAAPVAIARAADILMRSRACGLVVLDAPPLRSAIWGRLSGLAHKHGAVLVVISGRVPPELAAVSELRLCCDRVVPGNSLRLQLRHESVCVKCWR
jgi:hypothetical protein